MHRPNQRAEPSFGLDARPDGPVLLALVAGALYLGWRASNLGGAGPAAYRWAILALELWAYAELVVLALQCWRMAPSVPNGPLDPESDRPAIDPIEPVDLAVLTAGIGADELERTLMAARAVRSRGRIVVIDDRLRIRCRTLAADHGAHYHVDREAGRNPGRAAHRRTGSDHYAWLTAGQLPVPELVEVAAGHLQRDDLAVCQVAHSVLNADDLAHLGRDRDDDAVVNRVLGPALSRWGAGPWLGPASIVRRRAIDDIGGYHPDLTIERLTARLHRAGWTTWFERRRLVATSLPESMPAYLTLRRRRSAAAWDLLFSLDGPLAPGRLGPGRRLAQLGAVLRFGSGPRLVLVSAALVMTLSTGWFPADGPVVPLVAFWALATALRSLAGRALSRRVLGPGDWIRSSWRVAGAEVGALVDVATRRRRRTVDDPTGEASTAPASGGLRSLAHLPLLDATVLIVDAVLVVRGLTLVDHDLLPPFSTGQRVVVLGFALALLVPMVDVLQVVVLRRQRRAQPRIPAVLSASLNGIAASTTDITSRGVGVRLPFAPPVGAVADLELALPGPDGVLRNIVGRAEVRGVHPDGDDRWRVGLEMLHLAAPARRALIEFCAQAPRPVEVEPVEATTAVAVEPARWAELRRRRAVRRATMMAGLAAVATVVFGPGVASASGGAAQLVDRVCVETAGGGPVTGVIVERVAGDRVQLLGTTDGAGCHATTADPATTGFVLSRDGQRYRARPGDYADTVLQVALVRWEVRVVDIEGGPADRATVRFFAGRWRTGWAGTDPAVHQFEGLPATADRPMAVEVALDGDRHVVELDDRTSATIGLARLRLDPALGGSVAIDRGRGWVSVSDGADLVPGPMAVRLPDGTVLRVDVPEAHRLELPSGDLVPVPMAGVDQP